MRRFIFMRSEGMRRLCKAGVFVAAMMFAAPGVRASHSNPTRSIAAVAIATPAESVKLDGELTDAVWAKTTPVTEFLQRDPKEGAPPTHPTEVRVAFDGDAIYVAV